MFVLTITARRKGRLGPLDGTDSAWKTRHLVSLFQTKWEVRPMLNRKLSLVLGIALVLGTAGCQREGTTSSSTPPSSTSSSTPSPSSSSSSAMAPSSPSSPAPSSSSSSDKSASPPPSGTPPSSSEPKKDEPKKDKSG